MKKYIFIFSFLTGALFLLTITPESIAATKVIAFNGEVTVTIIKDGKPTQEKAVLKPGEALVSERVLKEVSLKKVSISWKDIAEYEASMVAREKDLYARLVTDNLWAARINGLLEALEKKYNRSASLEAVLEALGLPKERPSGKGIYRLIPGPNSPNPAMGSRVPYLSEKLTEFLDPYQKIENSPALALAEKIDQNVASPSR